MRVRSEPGRRGSERGVTLIEVLIAFLLMFITTLAVLQLFSMALGVNMGALARTDLSYAAEKTVETIRIQQALSLLTPAANNTTCCPLGVYTSGTATTYTIPTGTNCDQFWGNGGGAMAFSAGIYNANAKFTLSYTIVGRGTWREVTVIAEPKTKKSYLGLSTTGKVVRYVAQIP
jgi:Tfp pilus assembly protein PilV